MIEENNQSSYAINYHYPHRNSEVPKHIHGEKSLLFERNSLSDEEEEEINH